MFLQTFNLNKMIISILHLPGLGFSVQCSVHVITRVMQVGAEVPVSLIVCCLTFLVTIPGSQALRLSGSPRTSPTAGPQIWPRPPPQPSRSSSGSFSAETTKLR